MCNICNGPLSTSTCSAGQGPPQLPTFILILTHGLYSKSASSSQPFEKIIPFTPNQITNKLKTNKMSILNFAESYPAEIITLRNLKHGLQQILKRGR